MTRTEILQRLQTIKDKGTQALKLLESMPLSVEAQAEIRSVAQDSGAAKARVARSDASSKKA
jgi:hypothetical protein